MAKLYFKNNPQSTIFYDTESGLHLVNSIPGEVDYKPGIHSKITEAKQTGRIIEITEKEYKALLSEAEPEVEETTEEVEDEETTGDEELGEPSLKDQVEALSSKEDLIVWAEEQSFISEADLLSAKGIKKLKELKAFLLELIELEGK